MITYLGHKVEVVDAETINRKNKSKSWKYGYDPDIDVVIISKNGTLGDIYQIDFFDVKIGLPKPPLRRDIKNNEKERHLQYWRRDEMPVGLREDNWKSQHMDWVKQQDYYRKHGTWVYINGNKVYLTGVYWFFLQWVRIEEDYMNFRQIQNEYMIYWEACKADNRCVGMVYGKNRRMGATSMGVAELLLSGTLFREKRLGIMSKTGKDSKDVFDRLVTAFRRLPPFFKPKTDGTSSPKTELVFREPTRKRKTGERITEDTGMNTITSWFNTSLNSMDGMRMFRALLDESSKYPADVPFDKFWGIVKTSFIKGRVIFGKSMVVSTVNPMKSGGKEFKTVYYNSKKRDNNGRTLTGLYPLYIPAQYCLEGFFDKFGFSIVDDPEQKVKTDVGDYVKEGANTYLENIEQSLKNKPDELNEQLRQFPRQEKDMFRDTSSDCFFNILKLEEQTSYNTEELDEDDYGNSDIIRGNLTWLNGERDTKAVWHPDPTNGKFWVKKGCLPPPEMQNKKELRTIHGLTAYAPKFDFGCIGVDPFNREKTSDGRGSDGAMHLFIKYNTFGFPNDTFTMEYIHRPKKIEHFFEDVILAMNFFSVPILPELSSERFSHTLIERGYRHYVKNNPFKKWRELSPEEKKCGGINAQNAKFREEQYQTLNSYIEDYVGVARDKLNREVGVMGDMPFSRTLEQWKHADPNKRTDYDAYISSSLARLGCQSLIKIEVKEPEKFVVPFKRYSNKGNISTAV
jgi:hypothetical protein